MRLGNMLLHPHTHDTLHKLANNPQHAYIFHGMEGLGKFTAALACIAQRHPKKQQLIFGNNWEFLHTVSPLKDKKSIGIDQIKQIDAFIQLAHSYDTYVVIDDADRLTPEAQNAFLKTLEEPPEHIHIILIVHNDARIASTIHSRAQHVSFLPPPRERIKIYLDSLSVEPEASRFILHMSQAVPGRAVRLAQDTEELAVAKGRLEEARVLLSAPLTQRILLINTLNKDQSLQVLESMKVMTQAALRATVSKSDTTKASQWSHKANLVLDALENLQKNANQRLVMTHLVLNL